MVTSPGSHVRNGQYPQLRLLTSRNNMASIVTFHHERLYEIENLAGECYRMCYKPKRIQLRIMITKDSMGRVSDQCAFNNRKI